MPIARPKRHTRASEQEYGGNTIQVGAGSVTRGYGKHRMALHEQCTRREATQSEDGAALVEFALFLPLLLIVVLRIIDSGGH